MSSAPQRQPQQPAEPHHDDFAPPPPPPSKKTRSDAEWTFVKPEQDPWRHERINPLNPPPAIKRQYGYVPEWILDGTVTTGERINGIWHPHVPRHFYEVKRELELAKAGLVPWDEDKDGRLPPTVDEVEESLDAETELAATLKRDPYITRRLGQGTPCQTKIVGDFGSAFLMGAVGGTVWHGVKGWRNGAQGQGLKSLNQAVAMRASALGGNFAMWGGLFSCFDCVFKTYRSKEDPLNAIGAGFCTGGILAIRAGPKAALTSAMVGGVLLGLIEGLGFVMGRAGPSHAHQLAPLAPLDMAPVAVGGAPSLASELLDDDKEKEMERRPVMGAGGIPTGEFKMEPKQRKPLPLVAPTNEFDDEDDDDDEDEEEESRLSRGTRFIYWRSMEDHLQTRDALTSSRCCTHCSTRAPSRILAAETVRSHSVPSSASAIQAKLHISQHSTEHWPSFSIARRPGLAAGLDFEFHLFWLSSSRGGTLRCIVE